MSGVWSTTGCLGSRVCPTSTHIRASLGGPSRLIKISSLKGHDVVWGYQEELEGENRGSYVIFLKKVCIYDILKKNVTVTIEI